jgi:hypothetical protein
MLFGVSAIDLLMFAAATSHDYHFGLFSESPAPPVGSWPERGQVDVSRAGRGSAWPKAATMQIQFIPALQ